jgi:hypothetical protein
VAWVRLQLAGVAEGLNLHSLDWRRRVAAGSMALHYGEPQPADLPKHPAWLQQSIPGGA